MGVRRRWGLASLDDDPSLRHGVTFHVDIDGAANNLTLAHMNMGGDWGYGPGWMPLRQETWQVTMSASSWAVITSCSR